MKKKTFMLLRALAAIIPGSLALFAATSAEEKPVPALSAAAFCEGAAPFEGTIEIVNDDPSDPMSHTASIIDRDGNAHDVAGFGISGETLIILPNGEAFTSGIELGEPRPEDVPVEFLTECFISQVTGESRELTDEDIQDFLLDPALAGTSAEVETSITGVAWLWP